MNESPVERARVAYKRGSPVEALAVSEKALGDSSGAVSPTDRHDLLVLKSHCLSALGRWEEALRALDSAAQAEDMSTEARARLAMHKGYLMGSLARYSECWTLLQQAEQAARELGPAVFLAEVQWRRGMICVFAGEYGSAEKNLRSALEIASAEKNWELEGMATAGLGKNLMYCSEYVRAIAAFEKALAIFKELDSPFYVAIMQGELGTCYIHLGETDKALQLLEHTAGIFLAKGSLSNYQVSLADIGSVYLRRGEFLTAISYYQRALELARRLSDQVSVGKWLRNLCQAYTQLGSPILARGFEIQADEVNSRLARERKNAAQVTASLG